MGRHDPQRVRFAPVWPAWLPAFPTGAYSLGDSWNARAHQVEQKVNVIPFHESVAAAASGFNVIRQTGSIV